MFDIHDNTPVLVSNSFSNIWFVTSVNNFYVKEEAVNQFLDINNNHHRDHVTYHSTILILHSSNMIILHVHARLGGHQIDGGPAMIITI